jgi:hypothetical protein
MENIREGFRKDVYHESHMDFLTKNRQAVCEQTNVNGGNEGDKAPHKYAFKK